MITHKVFKSCEVKLVVFEIYICLFFILKVYNSFSNLKFSVNRYKLLQRDQNRNIGGFVLYVKEKSICQLLNSFIVSEKN